MSEAASTSWCPDVARVKFEEAAELLRKAQAVSADALALVAAGYCEQELAEHTHSNTLELVKSIASSARFAKRLSEDPDIKRAGAT